MTKKKVKLKKTSTFSWQVACGYACTLAVAWCFLFQPLVLFIMAANGHTVSLSPIPKYELFGLLSGMLGIGTLNTVERWNK